MTKQPGYSRVARHWQAAGMTGVLEGTERRSEQSLTGHKGDWCRPSRCRRAHAPLEPVQDHLRLLREDTDSRLGTIGWERARHQGICKAHCRGGADKDGKRRALHTCSPPLRWAKRNAGRQAPEARSPQATRYSVAGSRLGG